MNRIKPLRSTGLCKNKRSAVEAEQTVRDKTEQAKVDEAVQDKSAHAVEEQTATRVEAVVQE